MFRTVSSRSNHYIRTLAGNLALARRPERTDIPLGLLISRVQRGVLASFHFAVACGNSINSGAVTAVFFYFSPSLLSSLLASRFAKVVSERRFLRTNLVLNFKSGALRTLSIFGDGSEEESIGRSDDHCTWLVQNDSVPPRRLGSSRLRLC